ncbi:DUF3291 domain-containing protein [Robertkochia aurantiaca]|uniref:DUF3291 domain-containing protein n=1 Tax=Robertkochia aurantiaca TaxID=2873700 RepID=UPI001CCB6FE5|nr:DUF3291 domain-containing protein [Robertkochia sp. 3YJGBD-33]
MMKQVTTLTVFSYTSASSKLWAFLMMQFAHTSLRQVPGCTFYKLMGSGKKNFNPWPDWNTYALLQVWDDERYADVFFDYASLMKKYRKQAAEIGVIYMKNVKAKGLWDGEIPFKPHADISPDNPYIAAITRATIKKRYLRRFWNYVPTSQKPLVDAEGLLYTMGIGEVPVTQMATFSIWTDEDALRSFAYKSHEHVKAIGYTRKLDWYKEELFSRFQPYRSKGTLRGQPLPF